MGAEPLRHGVAAAFSAHYTATSCRQRLVMTGHQEDRENGEPFLVRWGPFIGTFSTILVLAASGIVYIRDENSALKFAIGGVDHKVDTLRDNVLNLNTPLSQRVFSAEARIAEIGRIQTEVRATLAAVDANGTSQNKILKQVVQALQSEVAGQNIRCTDLGRQLNDLQKEIYENKARIDNLIEALTPHEAPHRRLRK